MGGENQSYDDIELKENDGSVEWDFMENGNGVCSSDSESIESTLDEDYSTFLLSCSASQVTVEEDDASSSSSSSTSSSSPTSSGPLYELSELMDQLPIKRGLSNYYQGKSQSFTSLASVKRVEDLAKKASRPYRKREKPASCKKYSPKAIITKKSCSRGSSFVSSLGKNRGGGTATATAFANTCRPSISLVQKHLF